MITEFWNRRYDTPVKNPRKVAEVIKYTVDAKIKYVPYNQLDLSTLTFYRGGIYTSTPVIIEYMNFHGHPRQLSYLLVCDEASHEQTKRALECAGFTMDSPF